MSQRISEEIKGYPEVVAAYKGLSQRLARLNQLRDQGLVGEGKDGRVVLRAKPPQVGEAEAMLVLEENRDREVIILGMAKAILKLNRQEPTSGNLAGVKTQASETFASLRREKAQPGLVGAASGRDLDAEVGLRVLGLPDPDRSDAPILRLEASAPPPSVTGVRGIGVHG